MKRLSTLFMAVLGLVATASAQQTIYSLDFESGMPANVTLIDNDGLTPAANVSQYSAAWTVANLSFSNGTNCAISNSWYSPAGSADDWMITPQVAIVNNAQLSWEAKAQDANYPDGYEVWVSTSAPTVAGMTAGTKVFSIAAESSSFTQHSVDLSAFAGQSVYIGFRNNSSDMYLLLVDNIKVAVPVALDAGLTDVFVGERFIAPGNITVQGTIANNGFTPITSVEVSYKVNGGAAVAQTFSGLNIAPNGTYNFSHGTPIAANSGEQNIEVSITAVNGASDDDASNDVANSATSVIANAPTKKVMLVDHTGAWCQFCPDGTVIFENILADLTLGANTIGIAMHVGDAMEIPAGDEVSTTFVSGYPNGSVDFYKFSDQSDVGMSRTVWQAKVAQRMQMLSPVAVSVDAVTYNAANRQMQVTVKADFKTDISTDEMRFNLYVLEDSVVGSGTGYDQVNYYNTQAGHPYYGAGNPIVGFVHNHTVRAMLGGAWGEAGSLPATVTDGNSYTHTFTYILPAGYNYEKIKLVGMVQMYDPNNVENRAVLNSDEVQLTTATSTQPVFDDVASLNMFPNPATDRLTLELDIHEAGDVNIDLMNVQGQVLRSISNGYMNTGFHTVNWGIDNDIPTGMYLLRIKVGEQSVMKKLSIMK